MRHASVGYWGFRRFFLSRSRERKKGVFLPYHACRRSFRKRLFEQDLLTRLKVSWLFLFLLATLPLETIPFGRFFTSLSQVSNFRRNVSLFLPLGFSKEIIIGTDNLRRFRCTLWLRLSLIVYEYKILIILQN